MEVICCQCKKFIKEKEPLENTEVSHGICGECYTEIINEIKLKQGNEDETEKGRKKS